MEIKFQTKEESKKMQQQAFLQLSPMERFYRFLELAEASKKLFPKLPNTAKNNNFIITINS